MVSLTYENCLCTVEDIECYGDWNCSGHRVMSCFKETIRYDIVLYEVVEKKMLLCVVQYFLFEGNF